MRKIPSFFYFKEDDDDEDDEDIYMKKKDSEIFSYQHKKICVKGKCNLYSTHLTLSQLI